MRGVELSVAAGKERRRRGHPDPGDRERHLASGDEGILITPNGPGVEDALIKARDAGLFVIALDTPPRTPRPSTSPSPPTTSSPGQKIGEWAAAQLGGEKAVIAHDRPLRRQGRLGRRTTATRASSTAWASTLADDDGQRRRGGHRPVLQRRRVRDRRQRGLAGRRGRRPHRRREPAREEPRHQRRLHDQRARRLRRVRGLRGRGRRRGPDRRLGRRRLRRRRRGRPAASSAPPASSTR